MYLRQVIIYIVFILFWLPGFSQERIVPLYNNPVLYGKSVHHANKLKAAAPVDTLKLPFFDDFSQASPYPDSKIWMDSFIYVNNSYPLDPLSYGVATFDALDQYGQIYSQASAEAFDADMLTSKPIDLKYPASANVYFSFYYQPQGLGDSTETEDSLMVDFYNPASQTWWNVWKTPGVPVHRFKPVIFPVTADSFLVKGFQFRFRNKASIITKEFVPGKMGNVDQWNVDYIKLGANRTDHDTVFRDVAITKSMKSLLNTYESMPWNQFQLAFQKVMKKDIDITYRNNDSIAHKPGRYFQVKNLYGDDKVSFSGGNENIDSQERFHFSTNLEYPFYTQTVDSALFEVKAFLETDPYDYKANDTVRYFQRFANYFAYDDGAPESGYGLSGEGTSSWMVAYKFTSYITDTLRSVQIFFNSTENEVNKGYFFRLAVWSAGKDGPGSLLCLKAAQNPVALGKYTSYSLDTSLVINGDFYVGWYQTSEDFLNIGVDMDNSINNALFYNNGSWNASSLTHALMIRPVFRSRKIKTNVIDKGQNAIRIYPNPNNGIIHINGLEQYAHPIQAYMIDITGKVVKQEDVSLETANFSGLAPGIYLLVLRNNGNIIFKGKVIVQE